MAAYLMQKRGFYYFTRKVPLDLIDLHTSGRIQIALRTKSRKEADMLATALNAELEKKWRQLRAEVSTRKLVRFFKVQQAEQVAVNPLSTKSSETSFQKAAAAYLRERAIGRDQRFTVSTNRTISRYVEVIGNVPLEGSSREHALKFREDMISRGFSPSTMKRHFAILAAVYAFVEYTGAALPKNPFRRIALPQEPNLRRPRRPLTGEEIQVLEERFSNRDDELSRITMLLLHTGMRLSEGLGVLAEECRPIGQDFIIQLAPNELRRLKTASSRRIVPVIGVSACALRSQLALHPTGPVFPKYASQPDMQRVTVSQLLNKRFKVALGSGATVHGLRHAFRDRLRAAEVPSEAIDFLGGWARRGVGASYGDGYSAEQLISYVSRVLPCGCGTGSQRTS